MTDRRTRDGRSAAPTKPEADLFAAEVSFRPFGPPSAPSSPGLFAPVNFRPFPGRPSAAADGPPDAFPR